jgi:Ca-activated chloride channel family protein
MRFDDPIYLILLLAVAGIIYRWVKLGRRRAVVRFSNLDVLKGLKKPRSLKFRHSVKIVKVLGLILLIIALARPQTANRTEEFLTEGIDIILAIDVSGSMAAEDFKPQNRLHVAKSVVADFVKGRRNDRLGMVVFAGKSFTQCPLTLDYGVLVDFLSKLRLKMIEDGTAIGMAIANGVNRLRHSRAKSKVMILLTDGMNNKGRIDPLTAAKMAQALDIKIYTVGVGKMGGAPIPMMDQVFGKVYARNPDGSLVLTQMDEGVLIDIADTTGGKYFRATDSEKLAQIYEQINKMEKTEIEVKEYMRYGELFHYFAWPAFFLLLMGILAEYTVFRKLP